MPRVLALVLLAVLASVYLDWRAMPNQSSRGLPVLTLVEDGELRIDRYHQVTEDKARIGAHHYSEKAPLSSLITAPVYAVVAPLLRGQHPEIRLRVAISLGAALCGTVPFVLLLLWSMRRCRGRGAGRRGDILVALSFLGTFTFVYAGTFFGHLLAGALMVAAYTLLWERQRPLSAGLLLGIAGLAEYPSLLAAPVWGAQLLWARQPPRRVALLAAGLLPGVILIAAHNMAVTGGPLDFPYSHVLHQEYAGSRQQFGLGWPGLTALLGLTVGTRRGLFVYSPLLIWFAWRGLTGGKGTPAGQRAAALLGSPVAGLGLVMALFFSGYYMWWGGWAYGPRHLIPVTLIWLHAALPELAAGAVPWAAVGPLAGGGLLLNWAAKATHGYLIPDRYPFPAARPLLADLLGGKWSPFNLLSGYLGVSPRLVTGLWPAALAAALALLAWPRKGEEA